MKQKIMYTLLVGVLLAMSGCQVQEPLHFVEPTTAGTTEAAAETTEPTFVTEAATEPEETEAAKPQPTDPPTEPSRETEPPTPTDPSATEPPTKPAPSEPPHTTPPVTEPPTTEPPITAPPTTIPPTTEPPTTVPPETTSPTTQPPTEEEITQLNCQLAMEIGNSHGAAAYGWKVDPSLHEGNAGFNFGSWVFLQDGQERLNVEAIGQVDFLYREMKRLYPDMELSGIRFRVHAFMCPDGTYEVRVYYA